LLGLEAESGPKRLQHGEGFVDREVIRQLNLVLGGSWDANLATPIWVGLAKPFLDVMDHASDIVAKISSERRRRALFDDVIHPTFKIRKSLVQVRELLRVGHLGPIGHVNFLQALK
jgi:hypothetical protein